MTADESWRVYVAPDALESWSAAQLGSMLVHHASHLLRGHADRARHAGVQQRTAGGWLEASDAEVNDDLVDHGLELPVEATLPEDLGRPRGLLAEDYFEGHHSSDIAADCGSVADGLTRVHESSAGGLDVESVRLLRFQVAGACQAAAATEPGTVPASWQRWAREVLAPRLPWQTLLGAQLRRHVGLAAGASDYSYRRPSRRAGSVESVVLPALVHPKPSVAVVVDTSGSMEEASLAAALAETRAILQVAGVGGGDVAVLTCDLEVQEVPAGSLGQGAAALAGGGGTDLRVGIEAALARQPRPHLVVVLTDGQTPWPAAPPAVPVIVALLEPGGPEPPSWANTVRVGPSMP
jgi:predicted metal-dependent peptidase